MGRLCLKTTIAIRSPFQFPALETGRHGVDSAPLRHGGNGLPILPGDHVRGHLHHAALALWGETAGDRGKRKADARVTALFGSGSPPRDDSNAQRYDEPNRGALIVGDFVGSKRKGHNGTIPLRPEDATLIHRVKLSEDTGAAEDGMLQCIELAIGSGALVLFEGKIIVRETGAFRKQFAGRAAEDVVEELLGLVPAMGAMKNIGFGIIEHDRSGGGTGARQHRIDAPGSATDPPDRVAFDISIDDPLLVDTKRDAFNIFRGSDVIPGSAMKGTVAVLLADAGLLEASNEEAMAALSTIAFSHAFPLNADGIETGRALPCSLVAVETETETLLADTLSEDHDVSDLLESGPPAYQTDWKDNAWKAARDHFGRPRIDLMRQARGRTAISAEGTAAQSQLFVTELVETHGKTWRMAVDRNGADQAFFSRVVDVIEKGAHGLGRTGARFTGTRQTAEPAPPVEAGKRTLLLETPQQLTVPGDTMPLHEQYRRYFNELLGKGAQLEAFAAMRRWAGNYYGFRFAGADHNYREFELTEPGAVFRLHLDGDAAEKLSGLIATGLPAIGTGTGHNNPPGILPAGDDDWTRFPFVPNNGYGAFSLRKPSVDIISVPVKAEPDGQEKGDG